MFGASGHQTGTVDLNGFPGLGRERQAPSPYVSRGGEVQDKALGATTDDPSASPSTPCQSDPTKAHLGEGPGCPVAAAEGSGRERTGWTALPFGTYAPETGVGVGAFGVVFYRLPGEADESRPSSVAMDFEVTTRLQAIVELMPEFYFDEERWNLWTKWDYRLFPNSFWGIGADLPDNEERYSSQSFRGRAWLRRQVWDRLYAGINFDAQQFDVTETAAGGILQSQNIPGEAGGFTFGAGLTLDYDTRDNVVEAYEGGYYQLQVMHWNSALGSDYEFTRLTVDLRQFVSPAEDHAVGVQLYGVFNEGDVPFYQMAALGGPRLLRGYFEGRFVDNNMMLAQVEYRFPILWRFRGVAFAAVGDVMHRVGDFDFGSLEVAAGIGLRYRLNQQERFNLHFDIAMNRRGEVAPYIYASEAF